MDSQTFFDLGGPQTTILLTLASQTAGNAGMNHQCPAGSPVATEKSVKKFVSLLDV
jgi:hypothetical protein